MSEINIMHSYSQLKSKYTGRIADKACGSKSKKILKSKKNKHTLYFNNHSQIFSL